MEKNNKGVLLFFGLFDPPHYGHLHAATQALSSSFTGSLYDKVAFILCAVDEYGAHAEASGADRYKMVRLLIDPLQATGKKRFFLYNFSASLINGDSILGIVDNFKKINHSNIGFLIGSDIADVIYDKDYYPELSKKVQFIVAQKNGFNPLPYNPMICAPNHWLRDSVFDSFVSSHNIRLSVKGNYKLLNNTSPLIMEFIQNKKLYLRKTNAESKEN